MLSPREGRIGIPTGNPTGAWPKGGPTGRRVSFRRKLNQMGVVTFALPSSPCVSASSRESGFGGPPGPERGRPLRRGRCVSPPRARTRCAGATPRRALPAPRVRQAIKRRLEKARDLLNGALPPCAAEPQARRRHRRQASQDSPRWSVPRTVAGGANPPCHWTPSRSSARSIQEEGGGGVTQAPKDDRARVAKAARLSDRRCGSSRRRREWRTRKRGADRPDGPGGARKRRALGALRWLHGPPRAEVSHEGVVGPHGALTARLVRGRHLRRRCGRWRPSKGLLSTDRSRFGPHDAPGERGTR